MRPDLYIMTKKKNTNDIDGDYEDISEDNDKKI